MTSSRPDATRSTYQRLTELTQPLAQAPNSAAAPGPELLLVAESYREDLSTRQSDSELERIARELQTWDTHYRAAQAPASVKALRADFQVWRDWCQTHGLLTLPADCDVVLQFLSDQIDDGKKLATVKRYVASLATLHKAARLPLPMSHQDWPLKWKALRRLIADKNLHEPRQAERLMTEQVLTILGSLGEEPLELRDAALISLASDTLCRQSELVAFRLEHFSPTQSGWTAKVVRSKTDQFSTGEYRYVSEETMERIRRWCTAAHIHEGPIFLQIGRRRADTLQHDSHRPPLKPAAVIEIFRRRATAAGVPNAHLVTGHSTRVGAATEMLDEGLPLLAVRIAGGWKGDRMVLHYGRKTRVGQDGMATMRARKPLATPTD